MRESSILSPFTSLLAARSRKSVRMEDAPQIAVCAHCRKVPVKFRKSGVLAVHCSQSCARKALWALRREGKATSTSKYMQPRAEPRAHQPRLAPETTRQCKRCSAYFNLPLEGPGRQKRVCDSCTSKRAGHVKRDGKFIEFEALTRDEVFEWKADKKEPWFYARIAIQKRAREKYQRSNKPKHCVVCGWSDHIEVAHIKGAMSFPGDTPIGVINSLDNLIALCPNHHWCYDAGKLSAEDLEKFKGPGRIG